MRTSKLIKIRRNLFFALLLLFPVAEGMAQHTINIIDAEILKNRLDNLATKLMIPGYSVYLGVEGQFEWTGAFGYADLIDEKKAGSSTCYHCASITKPISACLLMDLVNEGKLSLEDPVLPYVLPILQQYGMDIDESVGEIKVKHLLSHTSDAPPGTYFRYDGDRYALLSLVIAKLSGMSPEDYFLSKLCQPLGLKYTTPCTRLDAYPQIKNELAEPYSLNDSLKLVQGNYTTGFSSSAGLISNVGDLAKFMSAYFDGMIIPKSLVGLCTNPFNLKKGSTASYGLGWYAEDIFGMKTIWHAGYGYSTSGLIMHIPEHNLSFVILSNCNLLSRPFPHGLPQLSLLESPFALEVFRMLLKTIEGVGAVPSIDWDVHSKEQIMSLYNNAGEDAMYFLRMEAKGRWNLALMVNDQTKQDKIMSIYRALDPVIEKEIKQRAPILKIQVNAKGHYVDSLSLKEQQIIKIMAVADGGYCDYWGMYDQVWIVDGKGQIIWEMNSSHTEFAGGHPRNRKACLDLIMQPGTYYVHYSNANSPYEHYPGHWEAFPPDGNLWGIALSTQENKE